MPEGNIGSAFRVSTGPLPSSRKVYVAGKRHPGLSVAMREIDLEKGSGEAPVRVYDPSGPYTDPAAQIDIRAGLPKLRDAWIRARGDVEEVAGRDIRPEDDGLKSGEARRVELFPGAIGRRPLRARAGKAVTQLAYARAGIVTPEM
jgi:phosphomethylpyrimidine synthase